MSRHGPINTTFKGLNGQKVIRYKDSFYEGIECINYTPCPICRRCENKNQYCKECNKCQVKGCYHKTEEKVLMGGRDRERKR